MEQKYQDPFISILKDNLKPTNTIKNPQQNNIKFTNKFKELSSEEELSQKIGKIEAIINFYEAKLINEFNERKLLERRFEDKIELLTNDVNDMKENYQNFAKMFTDNFSKIKNNIIEGVENKNNSFSKIIIESVKRINTLEDLVMNCNNPQRPNLLTENNIVSNKSINNSTLLTTERDSSFLKQNYMNVGKFELLSKKVNQLESILSKSYPGREEEINIGITKINHMEKKFGLFLENYNKDINIIKNSVKQNINDIENLNSSYNIVNEKYDNLYKNFNDTNININKFNYQTTILLNETQKKLEDYSDFFNNSKIELNKMENEMNNEYSLLKEVINEKINEIDRNINEFKNKVTQDNNEYRKIMEEKHENFINYIQTENSSYMHDAKKIGNSIEEQCNLIKKENIELNRNINEIKNSFFHNLNEIEQYFNRKYQGICRILNLKEK